MSQAGTPAPVMTPGATTPVAGGQSPLAPGSPGQPQAAVFTAAQQVVLEAATRALVDEAKASLTLQFAATAAESENKIKKLNEELEVLRRREAEEKEIKFSKLSAWNGKDESKWH